MSSSISEFPPVAKLCSNCEKAQFRDNCPQLFQAGSHLEFDEEEFPVPSDYPWGNIPTEFELVDSFPELPKLVESSQNGCDFCRFLHEAIILAVSERQIHRSKPSQGWVISVTISYMWGPLDEELISDMKEFYKWPIGLNAMRITFEDKGDPQVTFTLDCEIQSLFRKY